MLDALTGLAVLRTQAGQSESAFTLAVVIQQHPASTHAARHRAQQLQAELLPQLTTEQVARAQGHAQAALASDAWSRL